MDIFFIYLAKTSVCSIILYLFITLFLSKETLFRFNRYVLLAGVAACFFIPSINIQTQETLDIQKPFLEIESLISTLQPTTEQAFADQSASPVIGGETVNNIQSEKSGINWLLVLYTVYIIGFGFICANFLHSIVAIRKLIKNGQKLIKKDYTIIIVDRDIIPFSWLRYIVISRTDYDEHPNEIINHELAHIRHRHSGDVIFMQLILMLQWFNPAIWLLKRELQNIHEYQADKSVLQAGIDATKYQLLLVKKAVGTSSYTLANSFNHSKIKKRITMMLKEKSSKWAQLRLLLLLPGITLAIYAFARPEMNLNSEIKFNENLNTKVLPTEKQQKKMRKKDIQGTWLLVSSTINDKDEQIESSNTKKIKKISTKTFSWDEKDEETQDTKTGASGTYTFDGETYTETIKKSIAGMDAFVNKKAIYKVTYEDGLMVMDGVLDGKVKIVQKWKIQFVPPVLKK